MESHFAEEALTLFHQMQELKITPDDVTFLGVLAACCHAGLVSQGRGFFHIGSGLAPPSKAQDGPSRTMGRLIEVELRFVEKLDHHL